MSDYTVKVSDIVDQIYRDKHPEEEIEKMSLGNWKTALNKINTKIEEAVPEIFDFDYPYYGDVSDKKALEKHILESYYTRNICIDSVARWVLFLKDRMQDIMPRYKALYDAQVKLIASDLLNPYHVKETKDFTSDKSTLRTNESTSKTDSTSDTSSKSISDSNTIGNDNTSSKDVSKFSNTPQAMASAIDSGDDIQLNYLSTMQVNTSENDNNYGSSTTSSDEDKTSASRNDSSEYTSSDTANETKLDQMVRDIKGNLSKMNNAQLIKDYQDVILNIEKMIVDELKDLFYLIY